MTDHTKLTDGRLERLPGYLYLYFFCQSINLTAAVISVSMAATVGNLIAPSESLATLPYGMQFLILLFATYPVSMLMAKQGRKVGFTVGAMLLIAAGGVGYCAVVYQSFALLMISHALLGGFTACANYYRFAAVDKLSGKVKSRAVSLVIAGGLVAAFLGPTLTSVLHDIDGFALFSLSYAALSVLALVNLVLIVWLPKETLGNSKQTQAKALLKVREMLQDIPPKLLFAVLSAAVGFGIMNLLMIQSSIQMHHMQVHFDHSSMAIQWHVVAMFAPSLISGYLINYFGHQKIIACGFLLFIATSVVNVISASYPSIVLSLVLLGLAWNFTYVGGSAYISVILEGNENAKRWQGLGDTGMAILAMLGAMSPALLMSSIGWQGSNILAAVCVLACILYQVYLWLKDKRAGLGLKKVS